MLGILLCCIPSSFSETVSPANFELTCLLAGWPESPRDSPLLTPPQSGDTTPHTLPHLALYVGAGHLDQRAFKD